jgi:hypothetical protein
MAQPQREAEAVISSLVLRVLKALFDAKSFFLRPSSLDHAKKIIIALSFVFDKYYLIIG